MLAAQGLDGPPGDVQKYPVSGAKHRRKNADAPLRPRHIKTATPEVRVKTSTSCQCFIDLALEQAKTAVKKILTAALDDWTQLSLFTAKV